MVTPFRKNFKMLILLLVVVFTVTGCFVDEKNNPVIPLPEGSITLPIYKHGDFLEYNVFGTLAVDNVISDTNGSLRISFNSNTQLNHPFYTNQNIPNVITAKTTLTVNGLGTFITTRHITQDSNRCLQADLISPPTSPIQNDQTCDNQGLKDNPNYGSIRLIAIDDNSDDTILKRYWATTDTNAAMDNLVPPVIAYSPISTNSKDTERTSGSFDLLLGCSINKKCEERIARVSYKTQFAKFNEQGRPTVFGTFETLRTNSELEIRTEPGVSLPNYIIDVRAACGANPTTIISGDYELYPSIGDVYMLVSCAGTGNAATTFRLNFEVDGLSDSLGPSN